MRLVVLAIVTLIAFAANSVLNRMAVGSGDIDAISFAIVRLMSGAVALAILVSARGLLQKKPIWPGWSGRFAGCFGLLLYIFSFSLAYISLASGIGALILFGLAQITMFAGAVLARESVPAMRWLGAVVAFSGLIVLVSPFGAAVAFWPAVLMAASGIGWGIYSLAGRGSADPLSATAANFILTLPLAVPLLFWFGDLGAAEPLGLILAVISGAITSGMGYALWYWVVPQLGAARAAVAQLTVPILAALGGVAFLGEPLTLRFAFASALVLGGVALASLSGRKAAR